MVNDIRTCEIEIGKIWRLERMEKWCTDSFV